MKVSAFIVDSKALGNLFRCSAVTLQCLASLFQLAASVFAGLLATAGEAGGRGNVSIRAVQSDGVVPVDMPGFR